MATTLDTPQPDFHFTVFIRLPFPRGDFVDPPPVDWNAAKDRALWDILSRPSKGDDIDWKALAESFDVTLPFLLQQAAWLYDRQLSQVRAQMRRVGTVHSTSPSPAPDSMSGSTALAGQAMKRMGSAGSRVPTKLSMQQKDPNLLRGEPSPSTPMRTKFSGPNRTSSTATVTQAKAPREPSPPRPAPVTAARDLRQESIERRQSVTRREQAPAAAPLRTSPTLEEEESLLSSSSEESESEDDVPGRRFKRFGKFSTHRPGLRDDEDEEDESPAFLPLSRETEQPSRENERYDLNATLRLDTEHPGVQRQRTAEHVPLSKQATAASSTTTSSASSGFVGIPQTEVTRRTSQAPGPMSPQRAAEPSHLSPRRRAANGREVSDDTPSMGSSFSDLDDASVTQSALEEALLSNMQHGGMASRMSTISQALRSRYL